MLFRSESDVGRIKLAEQVSFKVDAFPKDVFHGVVSQKRMNATTVQNVVTYDTVIDFQNPDLKLFPGMTAYVTIPVASVTSALKIPNTALRFRPPVPPADLAGLYARAGISEKPAAERASAQTAEDEPVPNAKSNAGPQRDTAIVWKMLSDKKLEPVQIELGITDHAFTEVTRVLKGNLKSEDIVVTGAVGAKASGPAGPRG